MLAKQLGSRGGVIKIVLACDDQGLPARKRTVAGNDWLVVIATHHVLVCTYVVLINAYKLSCTLIRTISQSLVSLRSNGHSDGLKDRFQQARAANSSNNRRLASFPR